MDAWQIVAFLQPSHLIATLSGGLAGHLRTSAETIQRDPVPRVPHESNHSCVEMIRPHGTALISAVTCGYVAVRRMCEEPGLQHPSSHSFQGLTWLSSALLGTWVDDTNLLPPFAVLTTRVNFFCVEGVESLPLQVFF